MTELLQRFIEDRASLSESEAQALTARLEVHPEALEDFRGQLVVDELLHRRANAGRSGFVQRVQAALPADAFVEAVLQRSRAPAARWRKPMLWAAAAAVVLSTSFWLLLPQAASVQLAATSGEVNVWRDQVTMSATSGFVLKAGDWLLTGKDGTAEIEFPGETTRLKIGASAEFGVVAALPSKELKLTTGTLHASVARQSASHPMLIRTPTAKAEVLGTEFEMNATQERTQMKVTEGRVLIARVADENGVVVETSQSAIVTEKDPVQVQAVPVEQRLAAGLIAHWPFDEGRGNLAADVSKHDHDLTLTAQDVWSQGRSGGALGFHRGKADVMAALLVLPPVFTLSLWVRIQPGGPARPQPLLCFDGRLAGLSELMVKLRPNFPGSCVVLEVPGPTMGSEAHSKFGVVTAGTWHHLAITVDAVHGQAEFFVNARPVTAQGGLRRDFKAGGPLLIGRLIPGGPLPFDGQIDELRLYERALSAEEIAELAR
jgi:ferric-dicitrate binding protein FerR (iron transport regulator)